MSANIQGVCAVFKAGILQAQYNLGSTGDTLMAALYYQNSSLSYATAAYSATGEVSGTGYTAGGAAVTNANSPTYSGPAAYWTPSAALQWTGLTIAAAFDCWLLYDATASNASIAVFTMPAQTITSGTLTITMPTNAAGTGLLQVS